MMLIKGPIQNRTMVTIVVKRGKFYSSVCVNHLVDPTGLYFVHSNLFAESSRSTSSQPFER